MCGLPTTSKYGMCQRAGACSREYRRLWNHDQDKTSRNEIVRKYRKTLKTDPFVYAIWFPGAAVLKVGCATTRSSAVYVGTARVGARKRNLDVRGSSCIWLQPGDVRAEAWMQATLAFRWPGAFGKYQNRVCEWFDVSGLMQDEIAAALDEVYRQVPVDQIPAALHSFTAGAVA